MLILDAGAFVALERDDRAMWRRLKTALIEGNPATTHGGVIGQVWRGGTGRQALLARALKAVHVVPLDEDLGKRAGVVLAQSGHSDAIDAAVTALASHGDMICTSDPGDLAAMLAAHNKRVDVVPI